VSDTLVLCYHALSPTWPADLSVTPHAFSEQLETLHAKGYRAVTFSEAVLQPATGKRVAITFDDGFASVAALAKPQLDAFGWPATIFAVTGFAATGAPLSWDGIDHWTATEHAGELASLDWDGFRALQDAGWEVGSHTITHPRLTQVADAALAHELADSRAAVARALGACASIAYPYGDVDERVIRAAQHAGYAAAAALPATWHEQRPLEFPRAGVYFTDDLRRFKLKASPLTRAARRILRR
jgi:peptidoglycan/xylan/chitin deacetylase (PgdA/CDA1 family)